MRDFKSHVHELTELQDEIERLRDALHKIAIWSTAYPLQVFPKPDLRKAQALLGAGGMTLAALSADAMRHVVVEVGKMARSALDGGKPC